MIFVLLENLKYSNYFVIIESISGKSFAVINVYTEEYAAIMSKLMLDRAAKKTIFHDYCSYDNGNISLSCLTMKKFALLHEIYISKIANEIEDSAFAMRLAGRLLYGFAFNPNSDGDDAKLGLSTDNVLKVGGCECSDEDGDSDSHSDTDVFGGGRQQLYTLVKKFDLKSNTVTRTLVPVTT